MHDRWPSDLRLAFVVSILWGLPSEALHSQTYFQVHKGCISTLREAGHRILAREVGVPHDHFLDAFALPRQEGDSLDTWEVHTGDPNNPHRTLIQAAQSSLDLKVEQIDPSTELLIPPVFSQSRNFSAQFHPTFRHEPRLKVIEVSKRNTSGIFERQYQIVLGSDPQQLLDLAAAPTNLAAIAIPTPEDLQFPLTLRYAIGNSGVLLMKTSNGYLLARPDPEAVDRIEVDSYPLPLTNDFKGLDFFRGRSALQYQSVLIRGLSPTVTQPLTTKLDRPKVVHFAGTYVQPSTEKNWWVMVGHDGSGAPYFYFDPLTGKPGDIVPRPTYFAMRPNQAEPITWWKITPQGIMLYSRISNRLLLYHPDALDPSR